MVTKVTGLSVKRLASTDEWKVCVQVGTGKYSEDMAYYTDSKRDAQATAQAMRAEFISNGLWAGA